MSWTELYRLANEARCDLLLLDSSLAALSQSKDAALHARMTAHIPDAEALCAALDEHAVPTPHEVEARIVMRHRFVEFTAPPQPGLSLGVRSTA